MIVVQCHMSNFSAISWREQVTFDEIIMIMMMSASRAELDFYSARLLKQQFTCRHVDLLGHIILIPSQTVFVLNVGSLAEKQKITIL